MLKLAEACLSIARFHIARMPKMRNAFLVLALLIPCFSIANQIYRSPSQGDHGKYFLLQKERIKPNTFLVLTSRIGKNNQYTDFTKLKINCLGHTYLTLSGSSEDGAVVTPTKSLTDWSKTAKWTSVIYGSSKYD